MTTDAKELKEIEVSELLDGQVQGEELLCVIDMLLADDEARDFYLSSRALDKRLAEVRLQEPEKPMPNNLWNGIARQVGLQNATILPFSRAAQPFMAAAALVVVAVALGFLAFMAPQEVITSDQEVVVNLEANPEGLDDREFVRLTRQLLESDRKYHQKMYEIMRIVNTDNELYLPFEADGETENREVLQEAGEEAGPA